MTIPAKSLTLMLIAACSVLPGALAMESWCAEGACVNYEDESSGAGTCDEPEPSYDAYRGYSVTYTDDTSVTGAYVYQYCWREESEHGEGHGNALSVALTRLDWANFAMDGGFVYWESGEWNGESWCGITLHAHTPVAGVFEPLPCPSEAPPMLLPALP